MTFTVTQRNLYVVDGRACCIVQTESEGSRSICFGGLVNAGSRRCGWSLVVAAAFVVHTRALRAQAMLDVMTADTSAAIGESLPSSRRTTCIANVATTSLHRVPVFLSAWMMNRADSAFAAQADLLAQDVAAALRAELGGSDSTVTDEDGHLVWYAVPTSIVVTAHRNGDMSAHRLVVDGDSTAAPLLLRAFDAARAHGGAAMMWPDQVEKDSVFARIDLWPRYAHAKSEPESLGRLGHHFPVFTLTEPEAYFLAMTATWPGVSPTVTRPDSSTVASASLFD